MSCACARFASVHALIRGLSLLELMVSMTIASVLVLGAVQLYAAARATSRVNDSIARLQEQARFVMSTIEPDLELAGYYGFTQAASTLRLVRDGNPNLVIASAARMRQVALRPADPAPEAIAYLPAGAHACGVNFAVDVLTVAQGSNNRFELGRDAAASCRAYGAGHQPGTDTLTIRRAATGASAPEDGRLQIHASRLTSRSSHLLFADGRAPGAIDNDNRVHDLVVRAYYVARDSVDRQGFPALRVKALTRIAGAPAFLDDEIMPGVEDLQVQFGIDTGDYDNDGALDAGADVGGSGVLDTDGRATRYVDPDFPSLMRHQIVAVRIWVRVRAEAPEVGFVDDRTYRYADVMYTPTGAERGFRRLLVSRTVALRNARTL